MMGFRDREDGPAEKPRVSYFSGVDLTGWFSISSGVVWLGDEAFARVMATGDVAHITYNQERREFFGGVNWAVIAESPRGYTVMDALNHAAACNGGWLDYSKVIGWDCAEVKDDPSQRCGRCNRPDCEGC